MNRGRGITAEQIAAELTILGLPVRPGPYGYDLGLDWSEGGGLRLQRGSGIAGRGHAWCIVYKRDGRPLHTQMPYVESVKDLRWWLRVYMVGSQQPTLAGFTFYPRRNPRGMNVEWVWMMRRINEKKMTPKRQETE